jgi:hypothetical protein
MELRVAGGKDSTMDPHTAQVLRNMAKRIDELEKRIAQLEKREKFLELPKDMSLQEQVKALEEHKDTPMSYQELRERFG